MSVNWSWKRKKGFYFINENGKEFKVNIYCGNCLGVEIYEINESEYIFQGFWNDETHLENMLGLNKGFSNLYENVKEIHLFTNYKGWEKIARRFAKAKIKVILEYEEGECNE